MFVAEIESQTSKGYHTQLMAARHSINLRNCTAYMKKLFLVLALVTSCSNVPQANVEPKLHTIEPGRVFFADGKVSFVPPDGFRSLTSEEIARKFPRGDAPKDVFANETQSVSVGVTFSPSKVSSNQLNEAKESFEELLPRIVPGLQWQSKDIVEINGVKWVNLRFTSYATDTDIVNDMLVTSFQGKALIVSFNATVDEWEAAKPTLEASKSSIRIDQ
jgi:hypothetical protein